jgi:molybdenum cofactor biosynthesis enzyme MoaA
VTAALAYCDRRGQIYFDEGLVPLADAGLVREPRANELIAVPEGTVPMILPQRRPLTAKGAASRRHALAAALPAGYTRLLVPAYDCDASAPALPLFGYTFACAIDDELHVAAIRTDESEDWVPRSFAPGALEALTRRRCAEDPGNRVLAQLARCATEYGCFTAQNVFLERGEAALPVSPRCNARCVGCISKLDADAGVPSPQERIVYETTARELSRIAVRHLRSVEDGIVSFGQGCEGEPLLRSTTIARAIAYVRAQRARGTINMNTNGSLPKALLRCIDAGLDAVRVSLNSFRSAVYAAYYRPRGYDLGDVLESVRIAAARGIRVSLNLLTHPGVTDESEEIAAMERFLRDVPVAMVQTRTLNIDPEWYFAAVGRPREPQGMRAALDAIKATGARVGNFTHTH